MGYSLETDNLGRNKRKGLRKEWSFFCDSLIKVFSGKITTFDAITNSMLVMLFQYFNFGELVLFEIAAKLGTPANRSKNIYYARFVMLFCNHVNNELVIEKKDSSFDSLVQNKRVIRNLLRMNLNDNVELVYPPIV